MVKRGLAVGLAAVLLWPALLFAQTSKAGVVTVLEGDGTQGTITVNGTNLPAGATGGVTGSLVVVQGSGTTVKIGP